MSNAERVKLLVPQSLANYDRLGRPSYHMKSLTKEKGPEGVDPLILEFLPFLGLSCLIILHKKRGDEP